MRGLTTKALGWFAEWFASSGGVWQTLAVCLAIVAFEFAFPQMDPHAFFLMALLTVYSAVTQPALAYSGNTSSQKLDLLLEHQAAILDQIEALEESHDLRLAAIERLLGTTPQRFSHERIGRSGQRQ